MKKIFIIIVSIWGFCPFSGAKAQVNTGRKPNVILIMADDMGYGGLSSYGNMEYTTPNIDSLGDHGMKFTDFHSNGPVCTPTRAALLTGRYQQRSGLEGVLYVSGKTRQRGLSPKETTVADLLKKAGYRTGIMGKWHLGYKKKYNPVHQGFDQFYGYVSGNIDYHSHYDGAGKYDWWHNTHLIHEKGYTTDLITKHSIDFIEKNKKNPFFLYVAEEAPHAPYQDRNDSAYRFPNKKFSYYGPAQDKQATYNEMVKEMDEDIGKILKVLKKEGLDRNTLVIFCSDNGAVKKYGHNGRLRGYKTTEFEGGHRVPTIAYWPDKIKKGSSAETIMSFDFFPTILKVAGVEIPEQLNLDGIDLSPVLLSGEGLPERDLFWRYRGQKAIRRNQWKLLIDNRDKEVADTLLFNMKNDLFEQNNLKKQHSALVEQLSSALRQWEKEVTNGITLKTK